MVFSSAARNLLPSLNLPNDLPQDPLSRTETSTTSSTPSRPLVSIDRPVAPYGYHNTFHTHTQLSKPPPSYTCATTPESIAQHNATLRIEQEAKSEPLPEYTCTVQIKGTLGLKDELASPFRVVGDCQWSDVYVALQGTQLKIYQMKSSHLFSRNRTTGPGRLVRCYTLQHAEVGLATDFKRTPLIARTAFAQLIPRSARERVYKTDPHLFEPVREHVLRLRVEAEQILLCCPTQESLLDWIEQICAAIDISYPLEDRSEPRYRSLPRRSRRQRALDGSRVAQNLDNLSNLEAGRRLLAEQERIIQRLYPHLSGRRYSTPGEQTDRVEEARENEHATPHADGEADDYDPADVRFPSSSRRPDSSSTTRVPSREGATNLTRQGTNLGLSTTSTSSSDRKTARHTSPSPSQVLRYRRRCAPILLSSSPRASEVVMFEGTRARINAREGNLSIFSMHPPRYDAHGFPRKPKQLPTLAEETAAATTSPKAVPPTETHTTRPSSPQRGVSDESLAQSFSSLDVDGSAFGYELSSLSSEDATARLRTNESEYINQTDGASEPPSPTTTTFPSKTVQAEATQQLARLGKVRTSEEGVRDGFGAVGMAMGMLI